MRDVTLYENTERGYLSLHPPADAYGEVPAVVGITVAEVDELRAAASRERKICRSMIRKLQPRLTLAERERDKARKALDAVLIEKGRVAGITVAEIEQSVADLRDHVAAVARRASRHRRERDEAREALDVALIERNEAREALDDAIELAASAVRAHTRAIHHLAGNCDYPEDEQAATGRWLANALLDCREALEALGE